MSGEDGEQDGGLGRPDMSLIEGFRMESSSQVSSNPMRPQSDNPG